MAASDTAPDAVAFHVREVRAARAVLKTASERTRAARAELEAAMKAEAQAAQAVEVKHGNLRKAVEDGT